MIIRAVKEILEQYVNGKDRDRFELLETIYKLDSKVTFEIKPNSISFPSAISGNKEIAQVLSLDFNKKYSNVKTYYLSDYFPSIESLKIDKQNWLVLMSEKTSDAIYFGTGYYNWKFGYDQVGGLQIEHHHIFIETMIKLTNLPLSFLIGLQKSIPYPWASQEKVKELFQKHNELIEITQYLNHHQ